MEQSLTTVLYSGSIQPGDSFISFVILAWPDCDSVRNAGINTNGEYVIRLQNSSPTVHFAFCDLQTANHGWLVFQRRIDNTTNFDRVWDDYKRGFGSTLGNYWLGLDRLHKYTDQKRQSMLRIDLKFQSNPSTTFFAEYSNFAVLNESNGYLLKIGGYNVESTLPDSLTSQAWGGLSNHVGAKFSTKDNDNDKVNRNCAEDLHGGWWFNRCYKAYLNGLYHNSLDHIDCSEIASSEKYMTWKGHEYCYGGISFSEMKLRYLEPL